MSHLFKSPGKVDGFVRTNTSFEEVFLVEYDLPLKEHPKTVLDIGANEGAFTAWATKEWPECKVMAFEPVPENAKLFNANHASNPRVVLYEKAVWNEPILKIFRGLNNSGECSAFDLGEQRKEPPTEVECAHPSDIFSAEFVKVDTEGCEPVIIPLLNLSQTKAIVCEYHQEAHVKPLMDCLTKQGFEMITAQRRTLNRGVLKFARPGALNLPSSDSKAVTFPVGEIPKTNAKRNVFMATTALWSVDPHFFQCCLKAQQEFLVKSFAGLGVINGRFPELYAGESPVGRSRNSLTAQFLATDCTDILFIDSDLIFTAEQIERIVMHEEDVVGGAYCFKAQGKPRICCNPKPGVSEIRDDGLMEVSYIGTGFMRVRRHVFERMIEKYGDELWYKTDDGRNQLQHDFWQMGVYKYPDGSRRWLSEDWFFCQRCADMGIKVWCDMRCLLGHSGNAVYPLDVQLKDIYSEAALERMNKLSAKAEGAGRPGESSPSLAEPAPTLTPA